MNSLPNELLDATFAHFVASGGSDDRQDAVTLSNICLASRRLCHIAQPLLYRSIEIDVRSDQPQLLLATLKTRPELATAIKELFLECAATDGPTPTELGYRIRQFLEDVFPTLKGLRILRSNHRVCTTKLVESVLYKPGSGYHMSIPTDLSNLQSLELFADYYVFKYHFILRLPQLRRVVMHSTKILNLLDEDRVLPNDWGWSSQSIKELVLRLSSRTGMGRESLISNTLQALSRSLPCLECLRIEHHGTVLDPWEMRYLTAVFTPQLELTLRRLAIVDGQIDTCYPTFVNSIHSNDESAIYKIQTSNLEYLSIDWHTLFIGPEDSACGACSLTTLRHLTLRYVELYASDAPELNPRFLLEYVQLRFPFLKRLDLELRSHRPVDHKVLRLYSTTFTSAGIIFNVREHSSITPWTSVRRTGCITSSGRPSTLSP